MKTVDISEEKPSSNLMDWCYRNTKKNLYQIRETILLENLQKQLKWIFFFYFVCRTGAVRVCMCTYIECRECRDLQPMRFEPQLISTKFREFMFCDLIILLFYSSFIWYFLEEMNDTNGFTTFWSACTCLRPSKLLKVPSHHLSPLKIKSVCLSAQTLIINDERQIFCFVSRVQLFSWNESVSILKSGTWSWFGSKKLDSVDLPIQNQ